MKGPPPRFFVSCALSKWLRFEKFMGESGPFAIELALRGNDLDELPQRPLKHFRRYLEDTGLPCLVHAPFIDLNPGSNDRAVREAAVVRHRATIDLARELGARHVVFHTGYRPGASESRERSFWSWAAESFRVLASHCPEGELPFLLVENTQEREPGPLVSLRRSVGPRAGFCLDPGHANVVSHRPLSEWFEAFGEELMEIHLHDNHGHRDEHLACGTGTVPWGELFPPSPSTPCWSFTAEHIGGEEVMATRKWLLERKGWPALVPESGLLQTS